MGVLYSHRCCRMLSIVVELLFYIFYGNTV
nr:MAG TPA: hypothetical protein [Caudoviricetes sp.]